MHTNHMSEKATNLKILADSGFNVPRFLVLNINVEFYKEKINDQYKLIQKYFKRSKLLIIRPSLSIEDSDKYSFAGLMNSVVYENSKFTIDAFINEIENCKRHLLKGHIQKYCQKHGIIDILDLYNVSFIIQEFINGSPSGVIFTTNPVDFTETLVIESTFCLNSTVTSGIITPDILFINKNTGMIEKEIIGTKKILSRFHGNKIIMQNNEKLIERSVTIDQINEIAEIGKRIETLYSCPQDIEWIYYGDILYILQTRPIIIHHH